ncbi:MAG: hypothetical protein RIR00_263 [Pseudomonadota bacterium]|jgi:23S rRNA pseudouridine2605 synthase
MSKRTPFRPPQKKAEPVQSGDERFGRSPRPARPAAGAGGRRPQPTADEFTPNHPPRFAKGPNRVPAGFRNPQATAGAPVPGQGRAERLHKMLAQAGIASRRECEAWIEAGRVSVNGEVAQVGQVVSPGDRVKVDGKLVTLNHAHRLPKVLLYHKPEGEIVSRDDPDGRPNVFTALPRLRGGRWIAVGRLDFNTSGLLLFTTSGELANRLMHPSAQLVREYAVRILGDLSLEARQQLLSGVQLEDGPAAFASLDDAGGQGANHWYHVTLFEGRNREVRRMFEAVGCTVSRLMRVRYGPFQLPAWLKRGHHRELDKEQVLALQKTLQEQPVSAETGDDAESTPLLTTAPAVAPRAEAPSRPPFAKPMVQGKPGMGGRAAPARSAKPGMPARGGFQGKPAAPGSAQGKPGRAGAGQGAPRPGRPPRPDQERSAGSGKRDFSPARPAAARAGAPKRPQRGRG